MPPASDPDRSDSDSLAAAAPGRADPAGRPAARVTLRKPVNTLAIVPKSARITTLGRKAYNVLLYQAQEQGLDKDLFQAPLEAVITGVDFDSHDQALIKKHLRAMVSTTVEWQSPTKGEGGSWNVSGLLAHARLFKQRGQSWVEWSYAVNLKQELLAPTVFARLRLEVISQLRTHAGVALYEICTRYKDIGRTARQEWRWWHPVLTGNPPSDKLATLEYRVFKRDTLRPAIAEVNAITDIDIELVEHKSGRAIAEIQFVMSAKRQASLTLKQPPRPVDLALVARAQQLGIDEEVLDSLRQGHDDEAVRAALDSLERRIQSNYPQPLRDRARYLRALFPQAAPAAAVTPGSDAAPAAGADLAAEAVTVAGQGGAPSPADAREQQDKRRARWLAEWLRRRYEQCAAEIARLPDEQRRELEQGLAAALRARGAHPSLISRLERNGWQHQMVRHEMLRHYGLAAYGENWDKPSAEQLLAIAAQSPQGVGDPSA